MTRLRLHKTVDDTPKLQKTPFTSKTNDRKGPKKFRVHFFLSINIRDFFFQKFILSVYRVLTRLKLHRTVDDTPKRQKNTIHFPNIRQERTEKISSSFFLSINIRDFFFKNSFCRFIGYGPFG